MTDFSSFEQLDGWWGMGPEFKEEGWQGPPGSPSFSGFLTLKVSLENQGDGTLVAWCLMPDVPKPDDHKGDGISLTGGDFNFTDFSESEMSLEGVMFYSTDPASHGYVLTSDGHTVRKTASDAPTANASPTAAALADTGGARAVPAVALAASLALMISGLTALRLMLRRDGSRRMEKLAVKVLVAFALCACWPRLWCSWPELSWAAVLESLTSGGSGGPRCPFIG